MLPKKNVIREIRIKVRFSLNLIMIFLKTATILIKYELKVKLVDFSSCSVNS